MAAKTHVASQPADWDFKNNLSARAPPQTPPPMLMSAAVRIRRHHLQNSSSSSDWIRQLPRAASTASDWMQQRCAIDELAVRVETKPSTPGLRRPTSTSPHHPQSPFAPSSGASTPAPICCP
jgi:hypothetical protein